MAVVSPLHKHTLTFLGDQSVGKSSIITRFRSDEFHPEYVATIGIDFWEKKMSVEQRKVGLLIRDTSGQNRFRSLIPSYIRNSTVTAIVYDVADRKSFLKISKWIEEVRKYVQDAGDAIIVVLVGNKIDLVDERQVSTEEGDLKAREFGVIFVETSAKEGFNIKPLFQKIAAAIAGMEALISTKVLDDIQVVETRRHEEPNGKSGRPTRRYRCYSCGGDGHTVDGCWELLHPTVTETEHRLTGIENRVESTPAAHGVDLFDVKNDIKMLTNKLNYILQVQGASGPSTNSELQNQEENCHGKTGEWVLCSTPEL